MKPKKAENVLEAVPPLRFWGEGAVSWYCLAGAVTRYLGYIGNPVSYAEVMGVSGAAWRLTWNPGQSSPDNLIMGWYGHLLAEKRIADAFGYEYEYLDRCRETPRTEANLAAAELHRRESETMGAAHDQMPWGNVHGAELLKRLERANGEHLTQVIVQCKGYFAQAMGEIEQALAAEGV